MKTETVVILGIIGLAILSKKTVANQSGASPSDFVGPYLDAGPALPLGQACVTGGGYTGTWQRDSAGGAVCVADIIDTGSGSAPWW